MFRPSKKWWNAYGALNGKQTELDIDKPKKKIVKSCPSEQSEQFKLIVWLQKKQLIHHHSPNGMKAVSYSEAAKHKRLGTSSGFPDLILPYARKGHHGLFIELKRVYGGKLSERQIFWRDFLLKGGYAWHEAQGCAHAKQIICDYFDIDVGE